MVPPWLPNWQNPIQYPDPTKASRLDWAWEFLRRNPQYQLLWTKLIKPHYDRAHVDRSLRGRATSAQKVSDRVRPFLRVTAGDYDLTPFREQFGITTVPPDPSEPTAKLRFEAEFIRYARKPLERPGRPGWVYNVPAALQGHEVLVWFDLRWPISAQLNRAKELLAAEARRLPNVFRFRYRPDQYANYLRLLDARVVKAKDPHVAKVFYPNLPDAYPEYHGSHQVRADRAIAEVLRDDPWRIVAGGQ